MLPENSIPHIRWSNVVVVTEIVLAVIVLLIYPTSVLVVLSDENTEQTQIEIQKTLAQNQRQAFDRYFMSSRSSSMNFSLYLWFCGYAQLFFWLRIIVRKPTLVKALKFILKQDMNWESRCQFSHTASSWVCQILLPLQTSADAKNPPLERGSMHTPWNSERYNRATLSARR